MTKVLKDPKISDIDQLKEILIVPYCHADYSWTNSREWHKCRYIESFTKALEYINELDDFCYGIDNINHNLRPFMAARPDLTDELKQRVSEGRMYLATGGMALARPNHFGEETVTRNIIAGKKALLELFTPNRPLDLFFNADTEIGHSQMPQLLRLTGHQHYATYRSELPMNYKDIPKQFRWKGLDGSEVTVTRGIYGGFIYADYLTWDFDKEWDKVKEAFFERDLKDRMTLLTGDIVMQYYGGDDFIPMKSLFDLDIKLLEFMQEWNKREKPRMRFATPYEYFDILDQMELPERQGTLNNCELSFVVPIKGNTALGRKRMEMNVLLPQLESLCVMAKQYGIDAPFEEVQKLWQDQFEVTGHAMDWTLEDDAERIYDLALQNYLRAKNLIHSLHKQIANAVADGGKYEFAIINPLGFARTQTVKLHLASHWGFGDFALVDSEGNEVEYQIIEEYTGDKCGDGGVNSVDVLVNVSVEAYGITKLAAVFRDGPLRGFGNRTYHIHTGHQKRDERCDATIDNGLFTAEVKNGLFSSLTTRDGKTFTAKGKSLIDIVFKQTVPTMDWTGGFTTIQTRNFIPERGVLLQNGPVAWKYRISGKVDINDVDITMTIRKDDPAISFEAEIDNKGVDGYFTVMFDCDSQTPIHADICYGIEKRELKTEQWYSLQSPDRDDTDSLEQNYKGQFYANSFAAFELEQHPFALISENCSIFYKWDEAKGQIGLVLMRNFDRSAPEKRDERLWFWFYQCPDSVEGKGKHNFKFSLMVRDGRAHDFTDVIQKARALRAPLQGERSYIFDPTRVLPALSQAVTISSDTVIPTALYQEDGSYLLRFYEAIGQEQEIEVVSHITSASVTKVDLMGNAMEPTVSSDRIRLRVKPWEIVTLKLQ